MLFQPLSAVFWVSISCRCFQAGGSAHQKGIPCDNHSSVCGSRLPDGPHQSLLSLLHEDGRIYCRRPPRSCIWQSSVYRCLGVQEVDFFGTVNQSISHTVRIEWNDRDWSNLFAITPVTCFFLCNLMIRSWNKQHLSVAGQPPVAFCFNDQHPCFFLCFSHYFSPFAFVSKRIWMKVEWNEKKGFVFPRSISRQYKWPGCVYQSGAFQTV